MNGEQAARGVTGQASDGETLRSVEALGFLAGAPERIGGGDRPWLSGLAASALDPERANAARVYNYWLGGKDHFGPDRVVGDAIAEIAPWAVQAAVANRAFLQRVVRFLAFSGIDQFIDLGTGLPAAGAVHEVAQQVDPEARVVYIDHDPVVLAHSRALLCRNRQTITLGADVRDPGHILNDYALRTHLDLTRPVAVLFVAVLHFVTAAEDPAGIVAAFRDTLAPGSYVAITHVADIDSGVLGRRAAATREAARLYGEGVAPLVLRTPEQIHALFDGLELIEPGLVRVGRWRPDHRPRRGPSVPVLAGLGQRT